jgi:aminopeptidase YwaD
LPVRLALLFVFLTTCSLRAQDSLRVRETLNALCSDHMAGRGYVQDGDRKASIFLREAFRDAGLQPLPGHSWFQEFEFPVNSFPRSPRLSVDGKQLIPGRDFLVAPHCPKVKGRFELMRYGSEDGIMQSRYTKNNWMFFDTTGTSMRFSRKQADSLRNSLGCAGVIWPSGNKLTWGVSQRQESVPELLVLDGLISDSAKVLELEVRPRYIRRHRARNVVGYLPGTGKTDSALFVTAHYDHLGKLGPYACFPGANDNASGVTMLLELAHWFSLPENRPRYDLVFVAFAGEEAGLVGSKHFSGSDWYPLSCIRFLLNLDLLGTGEEGLMVVNSTTHPIEFERLAQLNDTLIGLPAIRKRGPAANSDHHWFAQQGVPAFFTYTLGGSAAYHDIYDKPEALSLKGFAECHRLFRAFLAGF